MTTTGSHPAIKLKKAVQVAAAAESARRPSQISSTGQLDLPGFNASRRRSTMIKPGLGLNLLTSMALRRMTRANIAHEVPKPVVKYENTYKLEPDPGKVFLSQKAEAQIEALMEKHMKDLTYDPTTAGQVASTIAEAVKKCVKEMNFPRYKLITTVAVGQCTGQGLEAASRCLWDESRDKFATICHRNKSMFAVVTVFAAYFD